MNLNSDKKCNTILFLPMILEWKDTLKAHEPTQNFLKHFFQL